MAANSGDWDCEYHYYYDRAWRMVELRDGSDKTLKQWAWGARYVDELVEIAINGDPSADRTCETSYHAIQNANFNVIGLVKASDGELVERYEYTPYGRRTVYAKAGTDDTLTTSPLYESTPVEVSGVAQPYGLCDIGHQGLMHDKEFGLIQNRYRYLDPMTGRWTAPDPAAHVDGTSLYQYVRGRPTASQDPSGLYRMTTWKPCGGTTLTIETEHCCPEDAFKIADALCSGYRAILAADDALWNHQNVRPWTAAHQITQDRLLNFFNNGRDFRAAPGHWETDYYNGEMPQNYTYVEPESPSDQMRSLVNRVRNTLHHCCPR